MAENTEIQWADATFNPWSGCTKVSPACDHCYAEVNYSVKMRGVKWGKYGNRIIASDSMWKQPLVWNRKAEAEGVRKRVFCASLADVFEGAESMPENAVADIENARTRLGKLILDTPYLDWLLLTKRPENVIRFARQMWIRFDDSLPLPPNVWIGTTVENQKYADLRIPHLLSIPAKVRFLSIEPLLGPIRLHEWLLSEHGRRLIAAKPGLVWIIVGGESGHKARPMHPDWVRSIRDQCQAAGVPFHFKQHGEWIAMNDFDIFTHGQVEQYEYQMLYKDGTDSRTVPRELRRTDSQNRQELPVSAMRVGKKNAGRLLDGREWNELPEVA